MRGPILTLTIGIVLTCFYLQAGEQGLSPEQPRQITTQPVQKTVEMQQQSKPTVVLPAQVEKSTSFASPIPQQQVIQGQPIIEGQPTIIQGQQVLPESANPVAATSSAIVPTSTVESTPPVSLETTKIEKPEAPSVPVAQPLQQAAIKPPEAPAPKTSSQVLQEEEKPTSIDTVDLNEPGGNWLYKRIWWEKGEAEYEKIQRLVQQIFELRMNFFNKRTELDRTVFDPFYLQAGLGRGELEELLRYLSGEVEAQRKRQGVLDEAERAFLAIMTKEQESLDQLKLDIEGISKLDNAIDDTLLKLIEQLNSVRRYEQQAWDNFKEISRVLNDKKARELYYGMVTFEENIVAIHNYIRKDLTPYFDQLIKTARDNVDRIKTTLQSLKEKGIDFKKKAQELESKENISEREKLRAEQERLEREQEEAEEQAAKSWLGWMKRLFVSLWDTVTGSLGAIYSSIKGLFVSSNAQQENSDTNSTVVQPET